MTNKSYKIKRVTWRFFSYDVSDESMHYFNALDEISNSETMELEDYHWKGPNTDESLPELAVKNLLHLKIYQAYCQALKNNSQPKAEAQIIMKIQDDLKQRKKQALPKRARGAYSPHSPEQVQELLDFAIYEGLSARKA